MKNHFFLIVCVSLALSASLVEESQTERGAQARIQRLSP